jgi:4-amino-4-deoxy-L-arabinose transferase-like glycosyltransferase
MRAILILLTITAVLISLSGLLYPFHHDEGIFLTIAEQAANGAVPYRDVFDHKPPGIYFTFAPFIRILGTGPGWPRIVMIGINVLSAYLMYIISQTVVSRKWAIFGSLGYLIFVPVFQGQFVLTEPLVVLTSLGVFYGMINFLKTGREKWLVIAGILAGTAIAYKQSGVVTLGALLITLLSSPKVTKLNRGRQILIAAGGALIPLLVIGGYFLFQDSLPQAWYAMVSFHAASYRPASLMASLWAVPPIILPIFSLWIIIIYMVYKRELKHSSTLIYSLSTILLSIPFVLFRPYHHYWLPIVPYLILICLPYMEKYRSLSTIYILNLGVVGLAWLYYTLTSAYPARISQIRTFEWNNCSTDSEPITYYLKTCKPPYMFAEPKYEY